MFKKISVALLCFIIAAACIGCGDKSESSSKEESSATEVVTEAFTEVPTEVENEDSNSEFQIPEADTAEVAEKIIGTWEGGYVVDKNSTVLTINDYCESIGVDPAEISMELEMEFKNDGTATLKSDTAGEESGTYTIDGAIIKIANAEGDEMTVIYNPKIEMIMLDVMGTGSIYIGFINQ